MTPSFKNKPVQGEPGTESAGYHGYWITDFTQIDPHLGTNEELKTLIDLAHERGIKVFFDIITNHTADVLDYPDSAYDATGQVPYVTKAAVPYKDAAGNAFDDRDFTFIGDPFPEVDPEVSFPYVPTFRDPADATVKVPAWLNDPTMYHNRGTSTFSGENSEYGDFPSGNRSALDDLWTERPEVVQGMIDIYKTWVEDAGVDGFRIDTVKHVNMDFWKQFGPALQGYAASVGNEDFFMFGEVFDADPRFMSRYTTEGRLQATVDFGFQGSGVNFAKGKPTTELRDFYALDDYFTDADSNVYSLPTFLGNHDMGRVGSFLRQGTTWDDAELLTRDELAHSLMYLTRGQPVVYYGDEQGFSAPPDVPGGIGDQRAREDMFPSQVALHNDTYDLIGTDATTADANFDTGPTRSTSTSPTSPSCVRSTPPWPTARRSTGTRRAARASSPSAGWTPTTRSSTSSRSTTPTPSRRRRSRPTSRSAARSRACGRPRTRATSSRPTPRAASPSPSRRCRRSSTGPTPSSAPTATSPRRCSRLRARPGSSPAAPRSGSPSRVATSPR